MKKKIFVGVVLVLLMFGVINSVNAYNISACSTAIPGAIIDSKIPDTTSLIIKVIKIAVPVLLVIFGSIDLLKGVIASKEDEIKKGQQIFIKRLIAGALVYFVFVVVQLLISFISNDDGKIMNCADCFINGGVEACQQSGLLGKELTNE